MRKRASCVPGETIGQPPHHIHRDRVEDSELHEESGLRRPILDLGMYAIEDLNRLRVRATTCLSGVHHVSIAPFAGIHNLPGRYDNEFEPVPAHTDLRPIRQLNLASAPVLLLAFQWRSVVAALALCLALASFWAVGRRRSRAHDGHVRTRS